VTVVGLPAPSTAMDLVSPRESVTLVGEPYGLYVS
jgi:hypothetical protein